MKSLKSKVGLILFVVFVLAGIINYSIQQYIVFPNFIDLERDEAQKDLERVVDAIKRELYHLDSFCHDWAAWDDTYDFVETSSQEYIDVNLVPSTFVINRINLIFYLNKDCRVVWGKSYDLETEKEIELISFPKQIFPKTHLLIPYVENGKPLSDSSVSGVVLTGLGPMMVSSRPVLDSNNEGPVKGYLIMGRFLDDHVARTLAEQTHIPFQIFPIQTGLSTDASKDKDRNKDYASQYPMEMKNNEILYISTYFRDIKGEPVFMIKAEISRKISMKGYTTVKYALISILVSVFVVFIVILWLLQKTVLRPIKMLTDHALLIGQTGDLSARVSENRSDEIGTLANEFDDMLGKLDKRSNELKIAHEQLKNEMEERKQAENALRESELRYRSFIQDFHGIAYQGKVNAAPEFFHGAVMEITGYNEDEFLAGEPAWEQIIHPDDGFMRREKLNEIASMPKSGASEIGYRIIRKDGEVRWVREFMRMVRDDASAFAFVRGAIYDVTDQKILERRLRETQKMEAIGTLAGGVAHDFNSILMTIVMGTEFSLKKLKENQFVRENLDMVLKAAYRARDLVEQLLTFSRKVEENFYPVNVTPLVKESLKMIRSILPETIEIQSNIRGVSGMVLASPNLINQILTNLCLNAAYAMQDSGKMRVDLTEETFESELPMTHFEIKPGRYFKLSVMDTGRGIPPHILDKIFEPFFTTKRPGEGSGMGLSVVHGIIKKINGAIRVWSEPEKGSVFDIFLPCNQDKVARPPIPTKGAGRILVVDDEDLLIEIFEKVLNDFGYEVIGVTSPLEAIRLFKPRPEEFDLIITDHNMPQMTGLELAEELISIRSEVPIILCTGFKDALMETQAKALGIQKILIKPLSVDSVAAAVNNILMLKTENATSEMK